MSNDIIIREIIREDNANLALIIRTVLTEFKANKPGTVFFDPTTDDLFSLFQTKSAAYFVVEINHEMVGGCGFFPTPDLPDGCCELVKLYLLKDGRGKGLGKSLMLRCFEEAKKLGYKNMYLETMPELNTAVGLYEQFGFKYLNGPMGNSTHFGCDIWMLKSLV